MYCYRYGHTFRDYLIDKGINFEKMMDSSIKDLILMIAFYHHIF